MAADLPDAVAPHDATALTVFLAPPGPAGGVLEVFADLAAVGLLERFLWIEDRASTDGTAPSTLDVRGTERCTVPLSSVLATEAPAQVRVCVIVPLDDPGQIVPVDGEQALVRRIERTVGVARVTRIRCLVHRPGTRAPAEAVAREGWHNVLVAPEESRGPGWPSTPLDEADALDVARCAAPTVAAVVGLWVGLDGRPPRGPGAPGVRAARAFYRRIEAELVEQGLRAAVLSTDPELPVPYDQNVTVFPITDPAEGCREMAGKLWARHRHELVGERRTPELQEREAVGIWAALKRFFRFIGAALRNAPAEWYRAAVNVGAVAAARRVQKVVYGDGDSAYQVVAKGMTAHGLPAGWRDVEVAAQRIDDLLVESREHDASAPAELTGLWQDFVDGALTLADAGERNRTSMPRLTTPEGYPAVVRQASACAPAPEDDFTDIPGAVAAETGITRVEPGDILGAQVLRRRLEHVAETTEHGFAAGQTRDRLRAWEYAHSGSYTAQVGALIAGELVTVYQQIPAYLRALVEAAGQSDEVDPRRSRALVWGLRVFGVLTLLGLIGGPVLAALHLVSTAAGVLIAALPLLIWSGLLVYAYADERRRLHHDLAARREVLSRADAARFNLREALRDLRRLGDAYEQYLEWSRIVGVVLRRPFGRAVAGDADRVDVAYGLSLTTRLAAAAGVEGQDEIINQLRTRLFGTGWLSDVWRAHRDEAIERHQPHGRPTEPGGALDLRGGVPDSALRAWANALVAQGPSSTVGARVWARGMAELRDPERPLGRRLLESLQVVPVEGGAVPVAKFLDGVGEDRRVAADEFHPDHFSPTARAAGVAAVREHVPARSTIGLSQVAGVVQYTEVLPPNAFAVTAEPGPDDDGGGSIGIPPFPGGGPRDDTPVTPPSSGGVTVPRAPRGFS